MEQTEKDGIVNFLETYCDQMEQELQSLLRERGFISAGVLASSEDIEAMWEKISGDFLTDAVREFQGYPVVTLAWASYLGMGVAHLWDGNWDLCCQSGYASFQGSQGFDDMDEHITQSILGLELESAEAVRLSDMLRSLAEMAHSFLRSAPVSRGSAEAYKVFLATMHTMFRLGAAVELNRLGYRMEPMS